VRSSDTDRPFGGWGMVAKPLLIFDFDGVIADSELLANSLLADYLTLLGQPTTVAQSIEKFMGKRSEDIAVLAQAWLGREVVDFSDNYRAYSRERMRTEVAPVAGVADFLASTADYPRCVASSSNISWLDHCVDRFGFRGHFGASLFSATEVKNGKPAPDIFLLAAERMRAAPQIAIVIEDSPAGVAGARAAGMTAIGFLGGSHIMAGHKDRLLDAGAHAIAQSYTELAGLIEARR
jgi:HAD superfamily hydrolase (TIGR01509 family)